MKILGIDPGSVFCGYGIIESNGQKLSVIEYGTIEVKKKTEYLPLRMKEIYDRILSVIDRTTPDSAATESVFYSKNVQSLIKLTMARSAAMLAVINRGIDIAEYSAKDIKRAVTGRGNANKEQVRYMMKTLLNIAETNIYYDTTDALAIAVCHSNHIVLGGKNSFCWNNCNKSTKETSWKKYLENNPDKIVKL